MQRDGELKIGLSYYQEQTWLMAIRKYGIGIMDKSLLTREQKEALTYPEQREFNLNH